MLHIPKSESNVANAFNGLSQEELDRMSMDNDAESETAERLYRLVAAGRERETEATRERSVHERARLT